MVVQGNDKGRIFPTLNYHKKNSVILTDLNNVKLCVAVPITQKAIKRLCSISRPKPWIIPYYRCLFSISAVPWFHLGIFSY